MKSLLTIVIAGMFFVIFSGCKKSESDSPTSPGSTTNYFPSNEGTYYKYSYSRTDSAGISTGIRTTNYKGTITINGTPYKIQIDSLLISPSLQVDSTFFRSTSSGIYYYMDTTGFAASITDSSLIPLIPYVLIDKELLGYVLPLQSGSSWPVFKINLTSPLVVTVVDVSALVVGEEIIVLSLPIGPTNKNALKIKYTMTLRLNPLSPVVQTYTAHAWLVQDIGPAKWEGCGTLVNFFTGLGIDFADTTTVVSQSLVGYDVN
ncbi:MAG: hypothetical protein HXY50_04135 [Ignavibacteriaceae bacterium]|nr:hypothetical protein [Ignavibacteriaceae bacterium]